MKRAQVEERILRALEHEMGDIKATLPPVRVALPAHHLSVDAPDEWLPDEMDPKTLELHGLYLLSRKHGVYFNVRAHGIGQHPLTRDGLLALLREQSWASAPFDEWVATSGPLTLVGGTFETVGMGGEVVLEVFVTDGHRVANLAGPGERAVIAAVTPSVRDLAGALRFE
jgi:hypothetical protein